MIYSLNNGIRLCLAVCCFNLYIGTTESVWEHWYPRPRSHRRSDLIETTQTVSKQILRQSTRQHLVQNPEEEEESTKVTNSHLVQNEEEEKTTKKQDKGDTEEKEEKEEKEDKEEKGGANDTIKYLTPYSFDGQFSKEMSRFKRAKFTKEIIGRTVEYNNILLYKITNSENSKYFRAQDRYAEEKPEKKIIFIVHSLSVMGNSIVPSLSEWEDFLILLGYYLKFLDKFDIYLIPIANPDGARIQYKDELWNKNYSPQSGCPGVMLDRNFDIKWEARKICESSCSYMYPGPYPFSEVESRAVRDVIHLNGPKIIAYIHVHGGTPQNSVFKGDAVLYPRGYENNPSDDEHYIEMSANIEEAMSNASFKVMSVAVQPLYNWYGAVTGTSVDYASAVYGITYALEFVMQPHESPYSRYALTDIWQRLINSIFSSIWKSLGQEASTTETKKRRLRL